MKAWVRRAAAAALIVPSACAQSEATRALLPVVTDTAPRVATTIEVTIVIPPRAARPRYVSPSTTSIAYSVDGGKLIFVALATSKTCGKVTGGSRCTIYIPATPGKHTLSFATYDARNRALSANTDVPLLVKTGTNPLALSLGGIATSLAIVAPSVASVSGSQHAGFTIYGAAPLAFTIEGLDADGNAIVGSGAPQPKISPAPVNVVVTVPSNAHPNVWTLTSTYRPSDPTIAGHATLSVVVPPVAHSGGKTLSANVPLTLYQPWVYVTNSNAAIRVYDEAGRQQTPAGSFANLSSPRGIAYDPHNGWLYVANSGSGAAVTAYDRSGNQQTLNGSGCAGLGGATGITFDAHTNWIYVTTPTTVTACDEAGNAQTLAGTFSGLAHAYGIAYDPHDGYLYVVDMDGFTARAYDEQGNTKTLQGSFTGLFSPAGIAFDPKNNWLYVTLSSPNDGGPGVLAFDEQGNPQSLPSSFRGFFEPFGITYAADQDGLYVPDVDRVPLFTPAGKELTADTWSNLFGVQDAAIVL